jgi:hypothetical protein
MKTKYWILILSGARAISLLCTIPFLMTPAAADRAEIYSQGELLYTLDLSVDKTVTVSTTEGGNNTITVRDGKIAVTASDCSGNDCVSCGWLDHPGQSIVCLPNGLEIRVLGIGGDVDFVVG